MKNTLIYITGFPASGKLTIAKALREKIDAFLIDNHTINNPIIKLVRKTGSQIIGEKIWNETEKIRKIVLDAMVSLGAEDANYIMTDALLEGRGHEKRYELVMEAAKQRAALFIPIKLKCKEEDLLSRVCTPERENHVKLTDATKLTNIIEKHATLPFKHPNMLEIDSSKLSPEESATSILKHIESL